MCFSYGHCPSGGRVARACPDCLEHFFHIQMVNLLLYGGSEVGWVVHFLAHYGNVKNRWKCNALMEPTHFKKGLPLPSPCGPSCEGIIHCNHCLPWCPPCEYSYIIYNIHLVAWLLVTILALSASSAPLLLFQSCATISNNWWWWSWWWWGYIILHFHDGVYVCL